MKKIILSVATATLLMTNANAFMGFDEATVEMQITQNLNLILQYAKQLEQYSTQLKTTASLTQNIGKLDQTAWNKFSQDFQKMQNIVKTSQGLTYAAKNFQQKFEDTHNGYESFLNNKKLNPSTMYQKLSEETRQTVKDNLKRLNMTQAEWDDDEATMQKLRDLSASKTGQLAAMQAASEIALHQTQTLKKLHQTMMMSANTQNQFLAAQQTREDSSKAFKQQMSNGNSRFLNGEKGEPMYRQLR
jgi:type IV secretion system protein TrbJ